MATPETSRRHAIHFFEGDAQVLGMNEAGKFCDVLQRKVSFRQQSAHAVELCGANLCLGRAFQVFTEAPFQNTPGDSYVPGYRSDVTAKHRLLADEA